MPPSPTRTPNPSPQLTGTALLTTMLNQTTISPPPTRPRRESRTDALRSSLKSLLHRKTAAEKAAEAARLAAHAAAERKAAAKVHFINGLQLSRDEAKKLRRDTGKLLRALDAQFSATDSIASTLYVHPDALVHALFEAHKGHYEVQELLEQSILERVEAGCKSVPWLREFRDCATALEVKMKLQVRLSVDLGWQDATQKQWPVIVETYRVLLPVAERFWDTMTEALEDKELWLAPLKEMVLPPVYVQTGNSRGKRLVWAKTAEVWAFDKEEIVGGALWRGANTYRDDLTDDGKDSSQIEPQKEPLYTVFLQHFKMKAETEAEANQKGKVSSFRRATISSTQKVAVASVHRGSVSETPARRASISSVPIRKSDISAPVPIRKGSVSGIPVRKGGISSVSARRVSMSSPATVRSGSPSLIPVRKGGSYSSSPLK